MWLTASLTSKNLERSHSNLTEHPQILTNSSYASCREAPSNLTSISFASVILSGCSQIDLSPICPQVWEHHPRWWSFHQTACEKYSFSISTIPQNLKSKHSWSFRMKCSSTVVIRIAECSYQIWDWLFNRLTPILSILMCVSHIWLDLSLK